MKFFGAINTLLLKKAFKSNLQLIFYYSNQNKSLKILNIWHGNQYDFFFYQFNFLTLDISFIAKKDIFLHFSKFFIFFLDKNIYVCFVLNTIASRILYIIEGTFMKAINNYINLINMGVPEDTLTSHPFFFAINNNI